MIRFGRKNKRIKDLENQLRSIWFNRLIYMVPFISEGEIAPGIKISRKNNEMLVIKLTDDINILYNPKRGLIEIKYVNKKIDKEKALNEALKKSLEATKVFVRYSISVPEDDLEKIEKNPLSFLLQNIPNEIKEAVKNYISEDKIKVERIGGNTIIVSYSGKIGDKLYSIGVTFYKKPK